MNPGKYLESRFVSCQANLQKKKFNTPIEMAENEAVIAWLWVATKVVITYKFLMILGHYIGVLCFMFKRPKDPRALADELVSGRMKDNQMIESITKNIRKEGQDNILQPHQILNVKG